MNEQKTNYHLGTGYWLNVILLLYPFSVTAYLAYFSEYSSLFAAAITKASVFNVVLMVSGLSAIAMIEKSAIKNVILRTAYFFQFIFLFVESYHFLIYARIIGMSSVYPMIDTNLQEMTEYIATNLRASYLSLSVLISFPMLFFFFRPIGMKKISIAPFYHFLPLLSFLCIAAFSISDIQPHLINYNPIFGINRDVYSAIQEKIRLNNFNTKAPSITASEVMHDDNDVTHILIIGESINRKQLPLYDYGRDTSPHLNTLVDNILVQQDTCS